MSGHGGPVTDRHHQPRTDALLAVVGMNINLLEMSGQRLENLDLCKPHGNSFAQCDPKVAAAACVFEFVEARCFGQDSIRCVSGKELGRSKLDGRQLWKITPSSTCDGVHALTSPSCCAFHISRALYRTRPLLLQCLIAS